MLQLCYLSMYITHVVHVSASKIQPHTAQLRTMLFNIILFYFGRLFYFIFIALCSMLFFYVLLIFEFLLKTKTTNNSYKRIHTFEDPKPKPTEYHDKIYFFATYTFVKFSWIK